MQGRELYRKQESKLFVATCHTTMTEVPSYILYLAAPHGLRHHSSLTNDRTNVFSSENRES